MRSSKDATRPSGYVSEIGLGLLQLDERGLRISINISNESPGRRAAARRKRGARRPVNPLFIHTVTD